MCVRASTVCGLWTDASSKTTVRVAVIGEKVAPAIRGILYVALIKSRR